MSRLKITIATLSAVWLYGQLSAQTLPIVAVHESELTASFETTPASGATPTGAGTTGNQWWLSSWNYHTIVDTVEESLRSDGTAYVVVSDADIKNGELIALDGSPKYPILISLAAVGVEDATANAISSYASAGGYVIVGSSSFTRRPDGSARPDFALASEMGVSKDRTSMENWTGTNRFTKTISHRLTDHIPSGNLTWDLPQYSDELTAGVSPNHSSTAAHTVFRINATTATTLANGVFFPRLTVNEHGSGVFIYDSALQPLMGYGQTGPTMYIYTLYRSAIEWAFESRGLAIPKLSPWPFPYNAAFNIRHDLENFEDDISNIKESAMFEHSIGVKGDYYFVTGTLRVEMNEDPAVIADMQDAVNIYGATIGSHNGGLVNPVDPALTPPDLDYRHWGPDEVLDETIPGYASGAEYASISIEQSFNDIETWIGGNTAANRIWVAPWYNATREESLEILEALNVKTAGDQKLLPFPHWTLSTEVDDKRFAFLSLPTSDWYATSSIRHDLKAHSTISMQDAVDFYYDLGAFINLYAHALSDSGRPREYLEYVTDSVLFPNMWSTNALEIYDWWSQRSQTTLSVTQLIQNGGMIESTVSISGATNDETAVEFVAPSVESLAGMIVHIDGNTAPAQDVRIVGTTVKVRVGTQAQSVTFAYPADVEASNAPPSISSIGDQSYDLGDTILPVDFTVGDAETPLNELVLSASSSNQALVDNANLTLTGTEANRSLNITPTSNATGSTTITVDVSDGEATTSESFTLSVTDPNQGGNNSGSFVEDDFNSSLGSQWTFINPLGDASANVVNGQLNLSQPGGTLRDLWESNSDAARLEQSIDDGDFVITVKLDSVPQQHVQLQGIYFGTSPSDLIRFDLQNLSGINYVWAGRLDGSTGSTLFRNSLPPTSAPFYMRVSREGDQWTYEHSNDGQNWTVAHVFTEQIAISKVGLWAGTSSPAYDALFDFISYESTTTQNQPGSITLNATTGGTAAKAPDSASYAGGESVELTATPDEDYSFAGWTGDASGTENPLVWIVDGDATIVATFEEIPAVPDPGSITVSVSGQGSVSKTPDNTSYAGGEIITISPTPAAGWQFLQWAGDASGNDNPLSWSVDGDANISAIFQEITNPTGDFINEDFDGEIGSQWTFINPLEDASASTIDGALQISQPTGAARDLWTGNTNGARLEQPVADRDYEITTHLTTVPSEHVQLQGLYFKQTENNLIRFEIQHLNGNTFAWAGRLNGNSGNSKFRTQIPSASEYFIRVSRILDQWTFEYSTDQSNWTIAGAFSETIEVSAIGLWAGSSGPAFDANFGFIADANGIDPTPIGGSLTLSSTAGGTVEKTPNSPVYEGGDQVSISATPDTGYQFTEWTGDAAGTDNPLTWTIDGSASITGNFELIPPPPEDGSLTLTVSGDGSVTKTPDLSTYTAGTSVDIAATAGPGKVFTGWSGDANGNDNPLNWIVDGDATINAIFEDAPSTGGSFTSDSFDAGLGGEWTFVNPLGDSTATVEDGKLTISQPSGNVRDLWTGNLDGARIEQDVEDEDFEIILKLDSIPSQHVQLQGIYFAQSTGNLVRFDLQYLSGKLFAWAGRLNGSSGNTRFRVAVSTNTAPYYMKITRAGDQWSYEYSENNTDWTLAGSFTDSMSISKIGIWAGSSAPAFDAIFDFVAQQGTQPAPQGGAINLSSNVGGSASKSPDQETYDANEQVTLTATAEDGYSFSGWSGDTSSTNNPLTWTVNGDATIVANFEETATGGASFTDDSFETNLANHWTIVNPIGDAVIGTSNGELVIEQPAGTARDLWTTNTDGARIEQTVDDEDFSIETKITAAPEQNVQLQGIYFKQAQKDLLRFEIQYLNNDTFAWAGRLQGGSGQSKFRVQIPNATEYYLKVTRQDDQWTYEYSLDRLNWTVAGTFNETMGVSSIGLWAGSSNPQFTAKFDYVAANGGTLTANATQGGSVNVSPDKSFYVGGETVELTANIDQGWYFSGWTGDASGDENPLTITIQGDTDITANFQDTPLTVGGFQDDTFDDSVGSQWTFVNPLGDSSATASNGSLTISQPSGQLRDLWSSNRNAARLEQTFQDQDFEIDIRIGTIPSQNVTLQGLYFENASGDLLRFDLQYLNNQSFAFSGSLIGNSTDTKFRINVAPTSAYFMRVNRQGDTWTYLYSYDGSDWTVAGSYTSNLAVSKIGIFAATSSPAFDADFDYVDIRSEPSAGTPVEGSVDVSASAGGSVTKTPDLSLHAGGSSVTIEALPDSGYEFTGWTGDASGNDNPLVWSVNGNASISATFAELPPPPEAGSITVSTNGSGSITASPDQASYNGGDVVSVQATPSSGWSFQSWSGDASGNQNPLEWTVDGDANITAIFQENVIVTNPISLWYGSDQNFGTQGVPQKWVNILGAVDRPDLLQTLSYTLNGGAPSALSIGPDTRRLLSDGDFNVEIDTDDLLEGANTVIIEYSSTGGQIFTKSVNLNFASGQVWPTTYTIDWEQVTDIQDAVQIVDGKWSYDDDGIRPIEVGYDRVVAIGDILWEDYEITVPVTVHSTDPNAYNPVSVGPGLGIVMRWQGHSDWGNQLNGPWQPVIGWTPLGADIWYDWSSGGLLYLEGEDGLFQEDPADRKIQLGQTYIFKLRVQTPQVGSGGGIYSFKMWEENETEPADWEIVGQEGSDDLPSGSLLLIAHHVDATFGDVQIVPVVD